MTEPKRNVGDATESTNTPLPVIKVVHHSLTARSKRAALHAYLGRFGLVKIGGGAVGELYVSGSSDAWQVLPAVRLKTIPFTIAERDLGSVVSGRIETSELPADDEGRLPYSATLHGIVDSDPPRVVSASPDLINQFIAEIHRLGGTASFDKVWPISSLSYVPFRLVPNRGLMLELARFPLVRRIEPMAAIGMR